MKQRAMSAGKAPIQAYLQLPSVQTVQLGPSQMSTGLLVVLHVYRHFTHPRSGLDSVFSARKESIQTPMLLWSAQLAIWVHILDKGSLFVPAVILEHIRPDPHPVCVLYATQARIKLE